MLKIIHRVNTIEKLREIPLKYGVEVDVRSNRGKLILHHDPFQEGESLEDFLKEFKHKFIILEIKEEGIEKRVIELCKKYGITNYFLLSVSFPFMYNLSKEGIRKMAVRFSEFESIETALTMAKKVDWVWVDTFTKNPLKRDVFLRLKKAGFRICIVCPERWGRSEDIDRYITYFKKNEIFPDAVMTVSSEIQHWEKLDA